ncbi:MAG: hypothetical protein WD205_12680, partial [Rhodothermales bacterium]
VESFLELSDDVKPDALLRFAIEHSENVYYRPSWREGLSPSEQKALTDRMHSGLPTVERPQHALKDDGLRLVEWQVAGIDGVNVRAVVDGFG